jgi:RNA recognition motif-containing protein
MNIYVGNLAYAATEEELQEVFAQYGEVTSTRIVRDRYSELSKGFGFVEMAKREDGERAVSELNGKEILGRALKVSEARPRNRPA